MADWQFPGNESLEEEGLADAGIETFRGAPLAGLARESVQNSMDAAAFRGNAKEDAPVKVVFELQNIRSEDVPGIGQLTRAFRACLEKVTSRGIKKEIEFFETALDVASGPLIPVLSVSDYGTTGLKGPATPGHPFHALVRASGVSQKGSSEAGGSFGIGKNAAFAVSALRTVFYSTLYRESGRQRRLVQGKSVLVSRKERGEEVRAKGYWGAPKYEPVVDDAVNDLPQWLVRSETGTTVTSIGFSNHENWAGQIVESLLRNFFSAIHKNQICLVVAEQGMETVKLDRESVDSLFQCARIGEVAHEFGNDEQFAFAHAMYEAVSATDGDNFFDKCKEFSGLGEFRLRILLKEGFPKRVGILRNGMYVTGSLEHFGEPFIRFPLSQDFVAVVEPADGDASKNLRDMENPQHDSFSAERIDDKQRRKVLAREMRKLGRWIREEIRNATQQASQKTVTLQELSCFFDDLESPGSMSDGDDRGERPESLVVRLDPVASPSHGLGSDGADGSSGGSKDGSGGDGRTTGDRRGKGRGTAGGRGGRSLEYRDFRNVVLGDEGNKRLIVFTPKRGGKAFLDVVAVGLAQDQSLALAAINGDPCKKQPGIELQENIPIRLEIDLIESYHGPVRVTLLPATENGEES